MKHLVHIRQVQVVADAEVLVAEVTVVVLAVAAVVVVLAAAEDVNFETKNKFNEKVIYIRNFFIPWNIC
jgi:hypothetical protein